MTRLALPLPTERLTDLAARVRNTPSVRPLRSVTGLGWIVAGATVAAWVLGAAFGWIEASRAAVVGTVVMLGCVALTVGRTALRVTIDPLHRRMDVGATLPVRIGVTNVGEHRLLMVTLEVAVQGVPKPIAMPDLLAPGVLVPARIDVHGARRGVITVGPAMSVRGDPFGLIRRQVDWAEPIEIFVHPRTIRLESFGTGLLRDLEGRTTEDVSMSDLAFHTLREYVPGDDRRYIHWRSSAKVGSAVEGGKFLVRQFRDTRRTHLLVIVDGTARAYDDPEQFETALSVGASVALRATEDLLDATLVIADQPVRRQSGRLGTTNRVLDIFARAELGGRDLAGLVASGAEAAPDATYAMIITGGKAGFGVMRRVASQLPSAVRTTVVCVDPTARSGIASVASPTVVTLSTLDELRGLLARREVA
jgi:uncharacterized protein (DUF58 family)